jgi:type I restriction enzyme R subunit
VKAAKIKASLIPDPHDYSEAETRDRFIDLMLREAGWGEQGWKHGHDIELEVPGMPNAEGKGYVDYVLWGDDGKPLAIVEAKRTKKDPAIGQQQAKLYADCIEQKYGRRPVIFYSNGYETWLWDDACYPPRAVQGFYEKDELELMIQRRTTRGDLLKEKINGKIVERPYQVEAIRAVGERFTEKHRRGLVVMATGSGKTRMVIALTDLLMRANWVKRVLFLADRTALVNQACGEFKKHLPASAPVNLVLDKESTSRVYISTYPTMMGLIEAQRFGVGHFDLIVIDEAHRSVYQKYRAIFEYFDAMLLGLTATPRGEVDFDTYRLFDLKKNSPTFAYDLEQAVADGYLVPPVAVSVPLKFQREGISYDDLTDEEKAQWDEVEWDEDGTVPTRVEAEAVNKWLFNVDTVDKVLAHLMTNGQKVAGGDQLGKTIVFAKNEDHAKFICERFDKNYPHLAGSFVRKITHELTYAQSLIDDFSDPKKPPHIAVSVDMLDTGIDVPEVVNLVFFKLVRSKTKFWQMIGRGTRLCKDLFGPGQDKKNFFVFDYCQNFEYFRQNPAGVEGNVQRSLGAVLFAHRLELHKVLGATAGDDGLVTLRRDLANEMHEEVAAMNVENFLVRPKRRLVEQFKDRAQWDLLKDDQYHELDQQLADLPNELPAEDEMAKRFDLLMLKLQLAVINHEHVFERLREQVREIADKLTEKKDVPMVSAQMELIQEVAGTEWWEDVTLPMLEEARKKLRNLVKFIERGERRIVYTDFEDQLGQPQTLEIEKLAAATDVAEYRKRMLHFLQSHQDQGTLFKLRNNERLSAADLDELEKMLFEASDLGDRRKFAAAYGDQPNLAAFIRSLIGLDREAAKNAFSKFLTGSQYNAQQIQFVNYIIDYLTEHGQMPVSRLYEAPYTDINPMSLDGLFSNADANLITQILASFQQEAA